MLKKKTKAQASVTHLPVHPMGSIADLQTLRQDLALQAQVEQRLQELSSLKKTGTKLKSLRGGVVDVLVLNCVEWPQEYVLSGNSKERVSYDQISITQWVAGFGCIMKEQNSEIKDAMIDYLVSLFDDGNDFSWDAAKASHAVLLCRMEQGEIKSYTEVDKIDRVRRANALRHHYLNTHPQISQKFVQKNVKNMPCIYFNQGICNQSKTHETKGILYRHVCSACFTKGKTFNHSEIDKLKKNIQKTSKVERSSEHSHLFNKSCVQFKNSRCCI